MSLAAPLHPVVAAVTARIVERSRETRAAYLETVRTAEAEGPGRAKLSCANWAHAYAAAPEGDKLRVLSGQAPNLGIVTAYNDVLSAHQPYEHFPELIRDAARQVGATAQVAGGVAAMCDGVTQGRAGMELSLFSRDAIALSTAVALSHDSFDAALMLGICDKIVPGLLMGALPFGHLPVIFVPGGPMTSGLPNSEKVRVRALYAEGKVGRDVLLESERKSYHGPGTCTFYGTANSNQMLMEIMGLHLPGAAFVHPYTPLRDALTRAAAQRAAAIARGGNEHTPLYQVIDERAFVNGMVGLHATGGSTNHTLHLVAAARCAGILIDWGDFAELSRVTPLLARIYPNGEGDVNHFQAAGGMAFLVRELLRGGLLHEDVRTVAGQGLSRYAQEPVLDAAGELCWRDGADRSADPEIVRPLEDPYSPEGGLRLLDGALGRAILKTSAVKPAHWRVEAPCRVFDTQDDFSAAFKAGELDRDVVAVVRFQGPQANGMPELHNLSPALSVLQDRGHHVALVTDGRMSGASGKVPSALHVTPEASAGGPLAYLRDGDVIRVDAEAGVLTLVGASLEGRERAVRVEPQRGFGRELFGVFRRTVNGAEQGATAVAA